MFDLINASFELLAGFAILMSIFALHKSKSAEGVAPHTIAFFTLWGIWNLIYYPSLGQIASTIGAISVAAANAFWLCQIVYYSRKAKNG